MRKIFCLILAVLFIVGTVSMSYGLSAGYRDSPGVGEIKGSGASADNCPRTFRLVRYTQSIAFNDETHPWATDDITPDTIVVWATLSEDDGVTVTLTDITQDSRVAGLAVTNLLTQDTAGNTAAQDLGQDNWGYIQTFGPAEATQEVGTTATAGDAFGTANSIGAVQKFEIAGNSEAGYNYGIAGFYMDSATSGEQDVVVFIRTD